MLRSRWGPALAGLMLALCIALIGATKPVAAGIEVPVAVSTHAQLPIATSAVLPTHTFETSGAVGAVGLSLRSSTAPIITFIPAEGLALLPVMLVASTDDPLRHRPSSKGLRRAERTKLAPRYIRV